MREAFDPTNYVIACYVVGVLGTAAMVGWSWLEMRRAEKRRDEVRRK